MINTTTTTDIIKILNATGDDIKTQVNYFTLIFGLLFIALIFIFSCYIQKIYNEPCRKNKKIYPVDNLNDTESINKQGPRSKILKLKHVNKV